MSIFTFPENYLWKPQEYSSSSLIRCLKKGDKRSGINHELTIKAAETNICVAYMVTIF